MKCTRQTIENMTTGHRSCAGCSVILGCHRNLRMGRICYAEQGSVRVPPKASDMSLRSLRSLRSVLSQITGSLRSNGRGLITKITSLGLAGGRPTRIRRLNSFRLLQRLRGTLGIFPTEASMRDFIELINECDKYAHEASAQSLTHCKAASAQRTRIQLFISRRDPLSTRFTC